MQKKIKIKLTGSACDAIPKHRGTVRGLGFRKVNQVRELVDTPEVRGMIRSINHLVKVLDEDSSK